jgi:hypothetical protein
MSIHKQYLLPCNIIELLRNLGINFQRKTFQPDKKNGKENSGSPLNISR